MSNARGSSSGVDVNQVGGVLVRWLLAAEPTTIKTKAGDVKTIIELRDPRRLSSAITIWLDGDGAGFEGVSPSSVISLHLEALSSTSKGRYDLNGLVDRATVEAAFAVARADA